MTELLRTLEQLDRRLLEAIHSVEQRRGQRFGEDPFAGLYLTRAQVEQSLGQPNQNGSSRGAALEFDPPPAFAALGRRYGLSKFDIEVLLLALAPEVDLKYERAYGFLADDVARKRPTVEVALNLLCGSLEEKLARRGTFARTGPLVATRLVELEADGAAGLLGHAIWMDPRVAAFLLGTTSIDTRLAPFSRLLDPVRTRAEYPDGLDRLILESRQAKRPVRLAFHGATRSTRFEAAWATASALGQPLLVTDTSRGLAGTADPDMLFRLALREAWLTGAILLLDDADVVEESVAKHFAEAAEAEDVPVILSREQAWKSQQACRMAHVEFRLPDSDDRRKIWRAELKRAGLPPAPELIGRLADSFRLDRVQIRNAAETARDMGWLNRAEPEARILASARAQSGDSLAGLTRRITPTLAWDELVLPHEPLSQLREIVSRARRSHRVMKKWGFARKLASGKGVTALFSGTSGTGKTMAAEILACELGLDLYKIDLAGVVSKYIGETEKNLDRIFAAAESANGILLFDEADSLFGKRSEVRDAHDRYANLEISYLLQKMEQYEGVAILATNLRANLDDAFLRRLAFSVQFPFPDEDSRYRIWTSVWPKQVPLSEDLDLRWMAVRFPLSGGNIRNVALAAAFLAAEEGSKVRMDHLLRATRREFQKMGKTPSEDEMAPRRHERLEGVGA